MERRKDYINEWNRNRFMDIQQRERILHEFTDLYEEAYQPFQNLEYDENLEYEDEYYYSDED